MRNCKNFSIFVPGCLSADPVANRIIITLAPKLVRGAAFLRPASSYIGNARENEK